MPILQQYKNKNQSVHQSKVIRFATSFIPEIFQSTELKTIMGSYLPLPKILIPLESTNVEFSDFHCQKH